MGLLLRQIPFYTELLSPEAFSFMSRMPKTIGAVQYLNTKPLVHGLAACGVNVVYDLPSRLADRLASGELDVALIPSIELFRGRGYRMVSDACIGCRGPVMSVKLFFRVSPWKTRTLALDEGSRTSASLARILLSERFGITPFSESLAIGSGLEATNADAVLLIGDRAIGSPHERFEAVWDLGNEWVGFSGLPFVFAMWVARQDVETESLAMVLAETRNRGEANLAAIAAAESASHGLTVPQCLTYLRDNLHYHFGPQERLGLSTFYRYSTSLGLAPIGFDCELATEGVLS